MTVTVTVNVTVTVFYFYFYFFLFFLLLLLLFFYDIILLLLLGVVALELIVPRACSLSDVIRYSGARDSLVYKRRSSAHLHDVQNDTFQCLHPNLHASSEEQHTIRGA